MPLLTFSGGENEAKRVKAYAWGPTATKKWTDSDLYECILLLLHHIDFVSSFFINIIFLSVTGSHNTLIKRMCSYSLVVVIHTTNTASFILSLIHLSTQQTYIEHLISLITRNFGKTQLNVFTNVSAELEEMLCN